jgi:hypothetical protein
MNKWSVVYLLAALGAITGTCAIIGLSVGIFVVPAAFVGTVALSLAVLLAGFGARGLTRAYRAATRGGSREELGSASAFYASARRTLAASAALTSIMAIVAALSHIDRIESFGPPLAIVLCSVFYAALCVLLLVEPFRASVERQISAATMREITAPAGEP